MVRRCKRGKNVYGNINLIKQSENNLNEEGKKYYCDALKLNGIGGEILLLEL